MTRIRRMGAADIPRVAELVAETFGGPAERDAIRAQVSAAYHRCPQMRPEHCFVAEDGGRVVARWQLLDLELYLAGAVLRVGGAQGVLVEPGHRGRGLPRALLAAVSAEAVACGFDLTFGFAQRAAFYARAGAAPVMPDYRWRVPVAAIPALDADRFRPATAADAAALLAHYTRANSARSGAVARDLGYWPWMPRRAPETWIHPEGYFGCRLNADSLELREIAGAGPGFHAEALCKLAALARARGRAELSGELPPDLPLVAHARRFGSEEQRRWPRRAGALARLTALARPLDKLAPQLEARLAASPHAGERVLLAIECGGGRWEGALGRGRRERKLELPLSSAGLLALLFGARPAGVVACEERLALGDAERSLASALFPEGHPFTWLADRF